MFCFPPRWTRIGILMALSVMAILLTAANATAAPATNVCGVISTDTVWTAANSPYVVTCDVTVAKDATLTVEPGVVVKFRNDVWPRFYIDGSLSARGTSEAPIVFTSIKDDAHGGDTNGDGSATSPTPGDWGPLEFRSTAHANLQHTWIGYGGGGGYNSVRILNTDQVTIQDSIIGWSAHSGIEVENASPTIRGNAIRNNLDAGIVYRGFSAAKPLTLRDNTFIDNASWAVWAELTDEVVDITLSGNTSTGSPYNGFGLQGTISGTVTYDDNPGFPFIVTGITTVQENASLTFTPGTVVKFRDEVWPELWINGSLIARGTESTPIVFTSIKDDTHGGDTNGDGSSTSPAPGDWQAIKFYATARGDLQHTWIGYGGGGAYDSVRILNTDQVIFRDSIIGWSAHSGIEIENASPTIERNILVDNQASGLDVRLGAKPRVENNAIFNNKWGASSLSPSVVVDVANNWWGDSSGPYHETRNPHGQGNAVSDGFDFVPWRAYPPTGTVLLDKVKVHLNGDDRFVPGGDYIYNPSVINLTSDTIHDAVLVLTLPNTAVYLESTGGGIFWPERHQVFWRLGDFSPWTGYAFEVKVRYLWGIPEGFADTAILLFGGRNRYAEVFDIEPYLNYQPVMGEVTAWLTKDEVSTERERHSELDILYNRATSQGFVFGAAPRYRLNDGTSLLTIALLRPDPLAFSILTLHDDVILAFTFTEQTFSVENLKGGMRIDFTTGETSFWGTWEPGLDANSRCPKGTADGRCCIENCMAREVAGIVLGKIPLISQVMKGVDCWRAMNSRQEKDLVACLKQFLPIKYIDYVTATTACVSGCAKNPFRYDCNKDLITCGEETGFLVWLRNLLTHRSGATLTYQVNHECRNGCYQAGLGKYFYCASDQTCVPRKGCVDCTTEGASCRSAMATLAKDPNEKFGPMTDLLPEQLITYTITYENEGAGRAYGVFVVDDLDEHLDETTLHIYGNGRYFTSTRTISWDIGELAPKGEIGSSGAVSFTVRLKPNLPSGTVISNQATVFFPSVPEETPTNIILNVLQPLVAVPASVTTESGQPVDIHLRGIQAGEEPLTYTVTTRPLYGELAGRPPDLVYTPSLSFVGQDMLAFTVSNGITESRPANVVIRVHPWSGDTTPPRVVNTVPPENGIAQVSMTPLYTDTLGAVYAPILTIDFSEAISATTVSTRTIHLTTSDGDPVKVIADYSYVYQKAFVQVQEPLQSGKRYRVTIDRNITDLRGNPMVKDYIWQFWAGPVWRVYLPSVGEMRR